MRWWMVLLVSVMLMGCSTSPDDASRMALRSSPLVGPQWELMLIGTDERWASERSAYFELFTKSNKLEVFGSDGCNQLRGEATLGEGRMIAISELVGTRMACAGSPQSTQVADLLSRAHRYLIDHDRLVLMGRDGHVLGGFRRKK